MDLDREVKALQNRMTSLEAAFARYMNGAGGELPQGAAPTSEFDSGVTAENHAEIHAPLSGTLAHALAKADGTEDDDAELSVEEKRQGLIDAGRTEADVKAMTDDQVNDAWAKNESGFVGDDQGQKTGRGNAVESLPQEAANRQAPPAVPQPGVTAAIPSQEVPKPTAV